MPVIENAKRALRVSKRKALQNNLTRKNVEVALRVAGKKKDLKAVSSAFSAIDRAAKKFVIHRNKAARMKSSLSKLLVSK